MAEGRLAGRIALVTGSSSGIGRRSHSASRGRARMWSSITARGRWRRRDRGEIRALGRRAQVVQGDVANAGKWRA